MYDEERNITLSYHAKSGIHLFHLGFRHSGNCIIQLKYLSRMNLNLKAYYDFDFQNFHCALPEDTIGVEMTIWMVDGIHTYRMDRTTLVTSYIPWSRQVKPFSFLQKKTTKRKRQKATKRETLIPSPQ